MRSETVDGKGSVNHERLLPTTGDLDARPDSSAADGVVLQSDGSRVEV
jgi:hypothetical protein